MLTINQIRFYPKLLQLDRAIETGRRLTSFTPKAEQTGLCYSQKHVKGSL